MGETEDRLRSLLRLNRSVVGHLHVRTVLTRIVEAAIELTGARYGALAVLAVDGSVAEFLHAGIDPDIAARIGEPPHGRGLLGSLGGADAVVAGDVTAHPLFTGFPDGHPAMGSFVGVAIRVGDDVFGNLYLADHPAGAFSAEDVELLQSLATTAGIAIEKARRYEQTRTRERWAAAGADVRAAFLAEDSARFAGLADALLELTAADAVARVTALADRTVLLESLTSALGDAGEAPEPLELPAEHPVARAVLAGDAALIDDVELAVASGAVIPGAYVQLVPMMGEEAGARGILIAHRTRPDIDLLERVAELVGQAGISAELARARTDRHRLALLDERGRIARDLHDHVIQRLFAAGLRLQALSMKTTDAALAPELDEQVSALDAAIREIRAVVSALRSRSQTDALRNRVLDVVADFADSLPEPPHVAFDGAVNAAVPPDALADATAVVREALANVVRHSGASTATVMVAVQAGHIVIEVVDDGTGLDRIPEGSSGLVNLRSRAERHGGAFSVGRGATGGTVLRWSVPEIGGAP